MKTRYTFIDLITPLALVLLLAFGNGATAATVATLPVQHETAALGGGGDDSKGSSDVKAEKTKSSKPKKVKVRRTNHGPRKPLYPQIHRKKDKLSRARFLNAQR